MLVSRDYSIGPVLALALLCIAAGQRDEPRSPEQPPPKSADLAVRLARSGLGGGFVLALNPALQDAFERTVRQSEAERSAFGFWFTHDLSDGAISSPSPAIPDVDDALRRYATAHAVTVNAPAASKLRTVKDDRASVCLARLQRVVTTPVEGTHLLKVLASATAQATGAQVPRGFVGSCIGTNQFVQEAVQTQGGNTLETTLNETVAAFGAAVWVAIQSSANVCSLGIIQRAEGGGVCTLTLAENLPGSGK